MPLLDAVSSAGRLAMSLRHQRHGRQVNKASRNRWHASSSPNPSARPLKDVTSTRNRAEARATDTALSPMGSWALTPRSSGLSLKSRRPKNPPWAAPDSWRYRSTMSGVREPLYNLGRCSELFCKPIGPVFLAEEAKRRMPIFRWQGCDSATNRFPKPARCDSGV